MAVSGIIKYFLILTSIAITHARGSSIAEYWQRGDEGNFKGANEIAGMEYSNDYKVNLFTEDQLIQKYTIPLNELNNDNDPPEEILVPASILKALEYINAHPDPQRHDESRRIKRF